VESLNSSIVSWIRENVLSQNVVAEALRYVRQLLGARTQGLDVELTQLRQDADRLRARLTGSFRRGDQHRQPAAVVDAIGNRQQLLTALRSASARRSGCSEPSASKPAAGERRRAGRLNDLSGMHRQDPDEARSAMAVALRWALVCTAVETSGRTAVPDGRNRESSGGFSLSNPVSVTQRPKGFEPLLQV